MRHCRACNGGNRLAAELAGVPPGMLAELLGGLPGVPAKVLGVLAAKILPSEPLSMLRARGVLIV